MNGADEEQCPQRQTFESFSVPSPAIVNVDLNNSFTFKPIHPDTQPCPETHFQCAGSGCCLPVFMRCNHVNDCPHHEDEEYCQHLSCPGLYRCRSSGVCVHPLHLCDGMFQCSQRDDELMCECSQRDNELVCEDQCPPQCTCLGLAFFCTTPFNVSQFTQLRYLHARGSTLRLSDVVHNVLLVHLALNSCNMSSLYDVRLPNLHSLDVSDNHVHSLRLELLTQWRRLRALSLAGNPFVSELFTEPPLLSSRLLSLSHLDLSRQNMLTLNIDVFVHFPSLQSLNLSSCNVHHILPRTLPVLGSLQSVDLRGSPFSRCPAICLTE